ncbi:MULTISPECIES: hypothetical protein [unclassified Nocardia]|uniref:hypothetical protein n=1 Tax=unclassified Nocardia TaxID=2637762 RepID=UPI001CE3CBEA|nr:MULTISPECIES: hypothetical protein [unclassified Nocardia]
MNKNVWLGVQIVSAVLMVVCAQAAIRQLFHHGSSQIWGLLDWVPGGWTGQVVALVLISAVGAVLSGLAHSRTKTVGE